MHIIVIFGLFLIILVILTFFALCLYICFQCYNHGFPEDDSIITESGESTTTTTRATSVAVDSNEINRHIQIAMEKLTKPSTEYDYEKDNEAVSVLSQCAICLEEFENTDLCRVFPNCKHMFHTHCIVRWLGINQTCPVCRTQL
ncbi:RING-H2 finger protein ATL8, partial [Cucurbita argyrosperma subsp. sororia]